MSVQNVKSQRPVRSGQISRSSEIPGRSCDISNYVALESECVG